MIFPRLEELIRYLERLDAKPHPEELAQVLNNTNISQDDINEVCRFDHENVRKNYISRSPRYDLVTFCLLPGQMMPVHDHGDSLAAFRVIEGTATEIIYEVTSSGTVQPRQEVTHAPGSVIICPEHRPHLIANRDSAESDLITLHVYTPPLQMNCYETAVGKVANL